jgi:hypothetical protein
MLSVDEQTDGAKANSGRVSAAGQRSPLATAFESASAVERVGTKTFAALVDASWSTARGPNGGYLAAIAARALVAQLDHRGQRQLRRICCHYHSTPTQGPLTIDVELIKAGRTLTAGRATARQKGKPIMTASGELSVAVVEGAGEWISVRQRIGTPPPVDAPAVPASSYRSDAGHWLEVGEDFPPIHRQARLAPVFGRDHDPRDPTAGTVEAGGWVYMPRQRLDSIYAVLLTDLWWPASFEALPRPAQAPTIGLTVDLMGELPGEGLPPQQILARFQADSAGRGFVAEDGELYLSNGGLVAKSRQLSMLVSHQ